MGQIVRMEGRNRRWRPRMVPMARINWEASPARCERLRVAPGMSDDKPELDVSPAELRRKAALYRQTAAAALDQRAIDALLSIAAEYEAEAKLIERARGRQMAPPTSSE